MLPLGLEWLGDMSQAPQDHYWGKKTKLCSEVNAFLLSK